MGHKAFLASPEARAIFEAADNALGEPLSKLCFEGPEDALRLTQNTQPALLTVSVALYHMIKAAGIREPDVCAGHSLGEYSAHVAAGTLKFEDAVRLVRLRGQLMQAAVPTGEGAMAAILGGDIAMIESTCKATGAEPVNYNSPGQLVIAGKATAVTDAGEKLKQVGCKVIALPVSAPFHSSWMRPAEDGLRPHLQSTPFGDPRCAVYANVSATAVIEADAARQALIQQVSRPVLWQQTIERMVQNGVRLFVEIGAGKVLTGLVGRIDKLAAKVSVQSPEDIEGLRAALSSSALP